MSKRRSLRKIPLVDRRMRSEAWPPIPAYILAGKTVGIVGLGRIGTEVARLCLAFNARVFATGKTLTDERVQAAGVTRVTMEELFRESDIVTIHAKSNPETRGLIGEKELGLMKQGAFLINTSRWPIVLEAALVHALERGQLGGVGLDVFDEEPLPFEHQQDRIKAMVSSMVETGGSRPVKQTAILRRVATGRSRWPIPAPV